MKRINFHRKSIIFKILIPVIAVMLLQVGFFYGSVVLSGSMTQLEENAFNSLNERTERRRNYLQDDMVSRWSNFETAFTQIASSTHDIVADYDPSAGFSKETATDFLQKSLNRLINLLRKNSVNGAYMILSGLFEEGTNRYGLYIRDIDPKSTPDNNSDLVLTVAPYEIASTAGIPFSNYSQSFQVDESLADSTDAYFFRPFLTYLGYREGAYENFGYWGMPRTLSSGRSVITYSVPLLISNKLLGVLGVDIEVNYIRDNYMPSRELAENAGSYVLVKKNADKTDYSLATSTGRTFARLFPNASTVSLGADAVYKNNYLFNGTEGKVYGNVHDLKLYNPNTPFVDEQWTLVGVMEEKTLMSFSRNFRETMLFSVAISTVLGLLVVGLTGYLITRPISSLITRVRGSDPEKSLELGKVNIYESDELVGEIQSLNERIVDSAGKLSEILSLAEVEIGAFEYDKIKKKVFFTEKFFSMLDVDAEGSQGYVDSKQIHGMFESANLELEEVEEDEYLYRLNRGEGKVRYLRIKMTENEFRKIGVLTDVTKEIEERRRIQCERDFDSLTHLYNRRAFWSAMDRLWEHPEKIGVAALVMMDVDNLKYVNDTYGHDVGDEYIRQFGSVLRRLIPYNVLLARRSGDEFFVFFYSFPNEEEIRTLISQLREWFAETFLVLPNQEQMRLRASGGVSWYPRDTCDPDALVKYADFAMYKVKNTVKGEFMDFNKEDYSRESFLLEGQEQLNKLIDGEMVEYHFQPIVDVADGSVFGYELLMRPLSGTFFKTPLEVLMLAKTQSKLSKIEKLTWRCALRTCRDRKKELPAGCRLFINSIPNQILSAEDLAVIEKEYGEFLSRVVVEFTEEEKRVEQVTHRKIFIAKRWDALLAVDDFGTGYNSEATLLELNPAFVKIDMFIVRNIDKDASRRQIFSTLAAGAHSRGIKVIAEGVETAEELRTLIRLGADYVQGYYLGKPAVMPAPVPESVRLGIWGKGGRQ